MLVGPLTQRGQHVPQIIFADDAVPVLVNDCESLRRGSTMQGLMTGWISNNTPGLSRATWWTEEQTSLPWWF